MKILIALVLALVVGVEIAAPRLVESQMESRVPDEADDALTVRADIDSFPFLTRLLLTERVERVTVTLEDVVADRLRFDEVVLELEGVTVDRGALFGGAIEIRDVDQTRAVAVLSEDELSAAVGLPVRLEPGRAVAEVAGARVSVDVSARDGMLAMRGGGVNVEVALPARFVPCDPNVDIEDGRAVFTCVLDHLPEGLIETLPAGRGR